MPAKVVRRTRRISDKTRDKQYWVMQRAKTLRDGGASFSTALSDAWKEAKQKDSFPKAPAKKGRAVVQRAESKAKKTPRKPRKKRVVKKKEE